MDREDGANHEQHNILGLLVIGAVLTIHDVGRRPT
jgi:hypothetical protein